MTNIKRVIVSTERVIDLTVQDFDFLLERKLKDFLPDYLALHPLPEKEKEFLEIDDAANLLHMAKATVYTKCSQNLLPYIKRGRKLLFEAEKLREWLKEGKKETVTETEEKMDKAILGKKK